MSIDRFPGRVWARRLAVATAGALIAVAIVRTGLGLGLSAANPGLAQRIDGGNAVALGQLSDRRMKTAQGRSDIEAVAALSRRAVLASPMEAGALRNLGFLVAIGGREDEADRILSLAGKLSKRDYFTHAWLLDRRFRLGDVVASISEADIVLRQRQTSWPVVIPELVRISGDTRILSPMTDALARRPLWRGLYLQQLGSDGRDASAVYAQLRLLRATAAPPSVNEMRSYFARFDGSENIAQLWSEWLALTPERGKPGLIRDGDFEGIDAAPPFNWTLYPNDGVYAELSDNPDGDGKSLYVSFEGGVGVGFAHQMLLLDAGSYRLTGRVFADEPVKPDQIAIVVGCGKMTNTRPIETLFVSGPAGAWRDFSTRFTVPTDCRGQHLTIGGQVGDFRSRAALWIDDLAIVRDQPSRKTAGAAARRRETTSTTP